MPISIPITDLLELGGRAFLPEVVDLMIKECESDPSDHSKCAPLADWLEENGEPDLAAVFRFIAVKKLGPVKRPEGRYWCADKGMPSWMGATTYDYSDSYMDVVIQMARGMAEVRQFLSK